jgi:type IV secretory pathway VirB10-like protein
MARVTRRDLVWLAIAALGVLATAVLIGGNRGRDPQPSAAVTVPAAPVAPSPATLARPQPAPPQPAAPSQPAAPPHPAAVQPAAPPARMDETTFWRLVSETRRAAGDDTGTQSELLKERLAQLPPQAIVQFARIRARLDRLAYRWDLWAAASVIEDGCSDDCFRDFRGYVISLGPGPYRNALRNPDSLASVAQGAERGDWEGADDVAADAYSSATDDDFPLDDSDLSGRPRGTPFDENGLAALQRRFPRLAARFR